MTYEAAIQLIKQKQSLGVQPGLSRMLAAMEKTGSVQNKLQVIHVAGTNGKGTVCAAVADGLRHAGYWVGVFSSPWVTDFREQITVDGRMIPKQDFADCVEVFAKEPLTEFELITAVMYLYFYSCGVDYAVVECGMGGAGDCTNVLAHPAVCAFAKVALDHTAFLGDTVEAIAREKSGIIKPGCPVVLYPHIAAKDVFLEQCRALHCPVTEAAEQGDPIADDLAVAGEVLRLLGVDTTPGLPMLPARREHFGENLLLDGAHNPDGAAALLLHLPTDRPIVAVLAMMEDKDIDGYLCQVLPRCRRVIATTVPGMGRALSAEDLAAAARKYCPDVTAEPNPHRALAAAKADGDFVLVCGSFYLAREIRKDLI